ncbi:MAG: CHAT domain-containing protein, partial [Bacteroidales bacterium]
DHESDLSAILISQATIDNYLQRYTIALSKIDKAIQYFKENNDMYYMTVSHTVKANILFAMGEYRQALQEYFSLLNLYNTVQLLRKEELYYLIGRCYMNINNNDSANYWLQRGISQLSKPSNLLVNYCCGYANFLLNIGKHSQALAVLEKNYPIISKRFKGKNQQMIYFLATRAKVLEKLGKYQESLSTYNQIFKLISGKSYHATSSLALPNLEKPDHDLANEIIAALRGKAELLDKMAANNTDYLLPSLQHYQKAAELAESYKRSISLEKDKLLYNEFNTQISGKIFALAVKLWRITESPSLKNYYLQLAFNISNTLKANVLTENIIENSLKQLAGIPISIQEQEKTLMHDILVLQNTIRDESQQANPNLTLIKNWQKQLVSYLKNLQEIESKNEAAYPLYRELKYHHRKTITVKELQYRLKPDENLLSYHWQDKQVFLFLINKKTVQLIQLSDTSLTTRIEQFRKKITHPSIEKDYAKEFKEYIDLAYHLYRSLLALAVPYLQGNKLIIVPDRQLNYIPFEALLFDTTYRHPVPDYGLLSYLIYRYSIRYAYSIHLFDYQQRNTVPFSRGVFAFAPTYQQQDKGKATNCSAVYRSQLAPLPGAMEEASEVVKIIGGKAFKGIYATESQFKKRTRQGYILHLAMHTLVDDKNPMYSKLAFAAENDSINDGFLNAFEIYGLHFSTPLVVLSACNTGYGKMMQGEGIYSLTRGFIYAGCPSMLFTLWQISDKPSKNLMQYFYCHIKQGKNIDLALRNAKIQYLMSANASMAHPYYWAAYCMTGKNEPIQFMKTYHQRIWIISLILMTVSILVVIFMYRRDASDVC